MLIWRKPNLNAQKNHLALNLLLSPFCSHPFASVPLFLFCLCLFEFFCCSFAFLFHLLFSLSLTLIIGIFYCLNDTLLLLHLITTHLVSHLFLWSILLIISTLIIGIFFCLNYTSLLLHLFITDLVIWFFLTAQNLKLFG